MYYNQNHYVNQTLRSNPVIRYEFQILSISLENMVSKHTIITNYIINLYILSSRVQTCFSHLIHKARNSAH